MAPVGQDYAIFTTIMARLSDRSFDRSVDKDAVIRMHAIGPGLVCWCDAKRFKAHNRKMLAGPVKCIATRIPIPDSHSAGLERELQSFFALPQSLFGLLATAYVSNV